MSHYITLLQKSSFIARNRLVICPSINVVSPSGWLGFLSLPAAAATSSSEAAGTVFMSKGVAQLDSVYVCSAFSRLDRET